VCSCFGFTAKPIHRRQIAKKEPLFTKNLKMLVVNSLFEMRFQPVKQILVFGNYRKLKKTGSMPGSMDVSGFIGFPGWDRAAM
jgi:hypothetical protein